MSDSRVDWPLAVLQERRAWRIRCAIASNDYRADLLASHRHRPDLVAVLEAFGLVGEMETLLDIAPDVAAAVLEALLCQSLLSLGEPGGMMPRVRAEALAAQFLGTFPRKDTRYFTNALWHAQRDAFTWSPFTDAVADGGLLAISARLLGCVWIEEND